MFEKFTSDARVVVVEAQKLASAAGSAQIEPLHLLAGLLETPGAASSLVARFEVSRDDLTAEFERVRRRGGMSDSDAEALSEFGIDVEQIVERFERIHGEGVLARPRRAVRGHIPFSAGAKKTLEQSLREAVGLGDKHIGQEHLLLALTAVPSPAAGVLAKRGIDHIAVRRVLQERKAS
jgi:ATP-dependent Clp protease ATP-binding subunit ClpA